jgi:hypothetical protein
MPMSAAKKRVTTRHATFSLGSEDLERIAELRQSLASRRYLLNGSEVVRLALLLLSEEALSAIDPLLKRLPRFRQGRPPKEKRASR